MLGCVKEENIDYRSGSILTKKGLTEKGCADLAASTRGGNFWTFKEHVIDAPDPRHATRIWWHDVPGTSTSGCWVKRTNNNRTTTTTGHVSGNRACGTTSNDSAVDSPFMKTRECMWVCSNMSVMTHCISAF